IRFRLDLGVGPIAHAKYCGQGFARFQLRLAKIRFFEILHPLDGRFHCKLSRHPSVRASGDKVPTFSSRHGSSPAITRLPMRLPLFCLLLLLVGTSLHAAEPFFKKDDVVALVGGEDMVAASEVGYLELILARALPDYHLHFRNLAWEGDTVF